jgi:hypothetical protein
MAPLVGVTETVGGLLLIAGLGTRLVAAALTIDMLVAMVTAHDELKFFAADGGVELELLLAVEPKRSGIIICVSGVRVPPPACEVPANRLVLALLPGEGTRGMIPWVQPPGSRDLALAREVPGATLTIVCPAVSAERAGWGKRRNRSSGALASVGMQERAARLRPQADIPVAAWRRRGD